MSFVNVSFISIPEFASFPGNEKKALLLHNLDPMFNIKSGFFFQPVEDSGLVEQVERFGIFDMNEIIRYCKFVIFKTGRFNFLKFQTKNFENEFYLNFVFGEKNHTHIYESNYYNF